MSAEEGEGEMKEIKKYCLEQVCSSGYNPCDYGEMQEDDDGDYVLYLDHKQRLAQKDTEIAGLRDRVKELEEMPIVCPVHKENLEELESEIEDLKRELNKCDCGICSWCNGDTYYHIKRKIRAKEHDFQLLSSLYNEPIHLGCFYNDEEGIKNIYILDKDGNETDRPVKAECLLARISKYFNRAKSAEAELEKARGEYKSLLEAYNTYCPPKENHPDER
jgi:hypothetical protein